MSVFPEQKPIRFGRYLLLDRINVGGMAEVFRGKSAGVEGFERLVALKRILPSIAADQDFIDMFIDEAKLAVQFQHANIAQIYDLGKTDDAYYIAMEYVSGVDLRTMWDRARNRNRLLPIAMSCYIMQRCCEGLDAAHRKKDDTGRDIGLVHRDVSPQNILISFEGEVKIIDFGIAKSKSKVSKTQAGILKGKFGYMSPEQVRGIELDNRSDIFACGSVLYELVVGDRLFLGESDFSTLEKVRNVEMVLPTRLNKNLSPHLERIVMKALAKNREDRYRWASEMAEDLQRYLFSSNQPFARTDMQRYMQQHFKEEMDKEKERLERYKAVSVAQLDGGAKAERRDPARTSATEIQPALDDLGPPGTDKATELMPQVKPLDPGGSEGRTASAIQARATRLGTPGRETAAGGAGSRGAGGAGATATASESSASSSSIRVVPVFDTAAKPRIPPWAAAVIGGLVAVILLGLGVGLYLARAKPAPGAITVEVSPQRAEIFLNDKLVSNTSPFTLDNLNPATYVLTVKKEGYETLIRAVAVGEGETRIETVALDRLKGTASISARSKPDGLAIWVDGKDTGRVTPATVAGLMAGDHQLVLKRGGLIVHRARVALAEGSAEAVEVDGARLPTLLDVVSEPSGARVLINGEPRGTTPATISMPRAGPIKVEIIKDGCAKLAVTRVLEKSALTTITASLACGR